MAMLNNRRVYIYIHNIMVQSNANLNAYQILATFPKDFCWLKRRARPHDAEDNTEKRQQDLIAVEGSRPWKIDGFHVDPAGETSHEKSRRFNGLVHV